MKNFDSFGLEGFEKSVSLKLKDWFKKWLESKELSYLSLEKQTDKKFDKEICETYRRMVCSRLEDSGAKLDDIAERLHHTSRGQLHNWKKGKKKIAFDTLFRAAAAFDVGFTSGDLPKGSLAAMSSIIECTNWLRMEVLKEEFSIPFDSSRLLVVWHAQTPGFQTACASDANKAKRRLQVRQVRNSIRIFTRQNSDWDWPELIEINAEWCKPLAAVTSLITYSWRFECPTN